MGDYLHSPFTIPNKDAFLIENQIKNSVDINNTCDLIIKLQSYYKDYIPFDLRESVFTWYAYLDHPTIANRLKKELYYSSLSECIGTYLSRNYIPNIISLDNANIVKAIPIRNHLKNKMENGKWDYIKTIYESLNIKNDNIVGDIYWTNYMMGEAVSIEPTSSTTGSETGSSGAGGGTTGGRTTDGGGATASGGTGSSGGAIGGSGAVSGGATVSDGTGSGGAIGGSGSGSELTPQSDTSNVFKVFDTSKMNQSQIESMIADWKRNDPNIQYVVGPNGIRLIRPGEAGFNADLPNK